MAWFINKKEWNHHNAHLQPPVLTFGFVDLDVVYYKSLWFDVMYFAFVFSSFVLVLNDLPSVFNNGFR